MVEFYEYFFEENPNEMIKAGKDKDGNIQFKDTGDDLIDHWEEQIARGQMPDLTEGMTEEEKNKFLGSEGLVDTFAQAQSIVDTEIQKQKTEKYRLDRN